MSKKFTCLLIDEKSCRTIGFSIHRFTLFFGVMAAFASIVLLAVFVQAYKNAKHQIYEGKLLAEKAHSQKAVIEDQKRQIQHFAGELNRIKSKLVALNQFEKKVKVAINIDTATKEDQESLFGIGGSIPNDLNANLQMETAHNELLREMHDQARQITGAIDKQQEGFDELLQFFDTQRTLLAATPSIRPTKGWITSGFGYRKSPFTGSREFHKGLDIAARKGTPVIAAADGVVSFVGSKGALGKTVVIDHGYGIVTRYAHLQKTLKKRGAKVKRGNVIATVGSSGRTTGSHLHYEVVVDGLPSNPEIIY